MLKVFPHKTLIRILKHGKRNIIIYTDIWVMDNNAA